MFRRDLRGVDNTALDKASRESLGRGEELIKVFAYNAKQALPEQNPYFSSRAFAFLRSTVEKAQRSGLIDRVFADERDLLAYLSDLKAQGRLKKVYFNQDLTPYARFKRDPHLTENFPCEIAHDYTLFDPEQGKVYQIFAPFYNRALPEALRISEPARATLDRLDPEVYARVARYGDDNDTPSGLSTYLKFGLISIRQAFAGCTAPRKRRELLFREFYYRIYWHNPRLLKGMIEPGLPNEAFRHALDQQAGWSHDPDTFARLVQGKTGNMAVDFMVARLYREGYLDNRERMFLASFVCKHLYLDWRWGEQWFAKALIDYDPIQNSAGWQWAASIGTDAAPYFRVMNPCNVYFESAWRKKCNESSEINLRETGEGSKKALAQAQKNLRAFENPLP